MKTSQEMTTSTWVRVVTTEYVEAVIERIRAGEHKKRYPRLSLSEEAST